MFLTDQDLRHVRAMLRITGKIKCDQCERIRAELAMELKLRKVQRRILRNRRRLVVA